MPDVAAIRQERKTRAEWAKREAAGIPAGDYYASGNSLVEHGTGRVVGTYANHWSACLVMLAVPNG